MEQDGGRESHLFIIYMPIYLPKGFAVAVYLGKLPCTLFKAAIVKKGGPHSFSNLSS